MATFLSRLGLVRKGFLESPTYAELQKAGLMRELKAAGVPIEDSIFL